MLVEGLWEQVAGVAGAEAMGVVVGSQINWFRLCVHEWPAGILYGMDGATPDQCQEILDEIAGTRQLDREGTHTTILDDVEAKVVLYKRKLESAP